MIDKILNDEFYSGYAWSLFHTLMENRLYVIIAVSIIMTLGIVFLYQGIHRNQIFAKVIKNIKTEQDRIRNVRTDNRYVSDRLDCGLTRWMDETFKYSRIYKNNPRFQNSYQFFETTTLLAAAVFVVALVITNKIRTAALFFALVFFLLYGYLFMKRNKNNRKTGDDIILFLNMLSNYSTANTEITSVFMQIAPKMNEPIRSCLVECVAESQNMNSFGERNNALLNLQAKIENKKFKEIVAELEIAQKYSGSFSSVADQNRRAVSQYIKSRNERQSLAKQNSLTMGVCVGALLLSMSLVGSIIEVNVFAMLFTTLVGNIVAFVALACIAYFLVKTLEVST